MSCVQSETFIISIDSDKSLSYSFSKKYQLTKSFDGKYASTCFEKGKLNLVKKGDSVLKCRLSNLKSIWKYNNADDLIELEEHSYEFNSVKFKDDLKKIEGEDFFLKFIFPMFNTDLNLGDSIMMPLNINLNLNESVINYEGIFVIKFESYLDENKKSKAILSGRCISNKIKSELYLDVHSTYVYDIDNERYIDSKINYSVETNAIKGVYYYDVTFEQSSLQQKYEDSTNIDYQSFNDVNSPSEIAHSVIEFLQKEDTNSYVKTFIPLEKQKKLFFENIEFYPENKDSNEIYLRLKEKYPERKDNFFVRANYLHQIMIESKGFDIKQAQIDTIYFNVERVKQYGYWSKPLIGNWADMTVEMTYNKEKFYLEIPQVVFIDNQWFLYYPEFYLRDESERKFVEKRMIDLENEGDKFWK